MDKTYTEQEAITTTLEDSTGGVFIATMVRVHGEWQYHCSGIAAWLDEPDLVPNEELLADYYKES